MSHHPRHPHPGPPHSSPQFFDGPKESPVAYVAWKIYHIVTFLLSLLGIILLIAWFTTGFHPTPPTAPKLFCPTLVVPKPCPAIPVIQPAQPPTVTPSSLPSATRPKVIHHSPFKPHPIPPAPIASHPLPAIIIVHEPTPAPVSPPLPAPPYRECTNPFGCFRPFPLFSGH